MKTSILGFLLSFTILHIQAQTKMEVEKRINITEVPEAAINFQQEYLLDAGKIKWYFEQDGAHQSYECKFKLHRKKYSIEFNSEGLLEDIEISYPLRKLPDQIEKTLERNSKKFNIKRSQIQFKEPRNELFQPDLWTKITNKEAIYFFELEVILAGEFFELLIDSKGTIFSKRRIVPPTGLYLEF